MDYIGELISISEFEKRTGHCATTIAMYFNRPELSKYKSNHKYFYCDESIRILEHLAKSRKDRQSCLINSNWTPSAIYCYKRRCRCKGCLMSTLESKCNMKTTLLNIIRFTGVPESLQRNDIIE